MRGLVGCYRVGQLISCQVLHDGLYMAVEAGCMFPDRSRAEGSRRCQSVKLSEVKLRVRVVVVYRVIVFVAIRAENLGLRPTGSGARGGAHRHWRKPWLSLNWVKRTSSESC